ncbi:MAG: terminase small subunit [Myxococcales bacterium]|nr:terminase small subunit [Myxococcales bacterium]
MDEGRSRWIADWEFDEYLTRAEIAELFGVSVVTVDAWRRRGMPCEERQGRGRPSRYNMGRVRTWLAEYLERTEGPLAVDL